MSADCSQGAVCASVLDYVRCGDALENHSPWHVTAEGWARCVSRASEEEIATRAAFLDTHPQHATHWLKRAGSALPRSGATPAVRRKAIGVNMIRKSRFVLLSEVRNAGLLRCISTPWRCRVSSFCATSRGPSTVTHAADESVLFYSLHGNWRA
jgi:hypothetical protein